jgi:hypothetical protein
MRNADRTSRLRPLRLVWHCGKEAMRIRFQWRRVWHPMLRPANYDDHVLANAKRSADTAIINRSEHGCDCGSDYGSDYRCHCSP